MTQHIQNVVEQQSSQQVSSQQQQFSVIPLCRRYSILVTVMKTIFVTPTTSDIQEDTTGMYTPVNMTSSNQRTSRNMILAFQFDPGHSTQLG
mmetsp:Transcript_15684/g.25080  ORF Transcript_15684/g.25080 Transcript_15684/m.25080 type:complete len:92 (+) Transcript_15684:254-529(+)